tara:strand:+ start:231 stop:518 length:288 start_codon:yes stop_codon:yes gene_type:complete
MMKDKIYFKSFVDRNRENLKAHLNAGYIDYSREGYLTLIKIISNEIGNPDQDRESLRTVCKDLANEVMELREAFDDEVYVRYFENKKIINFIENN